MSFPPHLFCISPLPSSSLPNNPVLLFLRLNTLTSLCTSASVFHLSLPSHSLLVSAICSHSLNFIEVLHFNFFSIMNFFDEIRM
ncbi:hypothetical protein RchiOBHm_Chr7g0216191 [Rosa chinensis]|uniref:Uncharacterized protein n=1 Tax=Rosa chinensis TaxID=74649 RepID=A0A2P6PBM8_ROSCH|nr:hypothetical protein RchiOBHm_Chr7g0216191 [Rosa chinensis]